MQIDQLIYHLKDDFEITKAIKEAIKEYLQKVEVEGGKDFFVKHTKKMDYFISLIYKYILKKDFEEFLPSLNNIPISIIALGSYGREQLSIYSDIDIMIVYKDLKGYNIKDILENFITMLWDLGLKIGHRVHEVKDIFPASNEDITIKTAMLESRFIIGSKYIWFETQNELNKIRNYKKKEFILGKYEEMKNRHKKHPISMEPNIKDGFGGIRDANTLFWINKAIFNYPNNSYLVPKYASEEDYKEYRNALEFLFKVRVFLHQSAKKKTDTVHLQYQRDIALKMGYTDSPRLVAERKFIRDLLKSLWKINTFCESTIKQIIKPYLYSMSYSQAKSKRLTKDIYLCENSLYSTFNNRYDFDSYIKELLKPSYKRLDISAIYNLKQKTFNMPPSSVKELFYHNLYPLMFGAYRANKIEKIFPPFEKIKHLAQFDGYHHYPVDIHSLYTLKEIENLDEFKTLTPNEQAMLRFSALFHDIGKGRSEDHSIIGAKIAKEFALKIDIPYPQTIHKLIRHHTLMSNISQREDIYNDKVILSFAEVVENKEFLTYLYLLTIADIKAVGEGVFTSFKANLLKTLYENTLKALENKELITEIGTRKRKEKILQNKEEYKTLPLKIRKNILKSPSNQLFLQNSTNEIIKILNWIKDINEYDVKFENKKHLIIHLAKKDTLNFSLGWFLEKLHNLNVNHLSIYKIGDIKYFKIEFDKKVDEWDLETITRYIAEGFSPKEIRNKLKFKKEEFVLDCNHSQNYAALKLKTEDKKGIISTLMDTFDKFGISVEDVKITVHKNIVRDLFIIPKESGFCQKYENILKELT
ncbi:MAG: HD domain-containing protein [Epsilonproteobacteria bacterium]|nr:HD domain-containing protein [Campylobacterota bacterium]